MRLMRAAREFPAGSSFLATVGKFEARSGVTGEYRAAPHTEKKSVAGHQKVLLPPIPETTEEIVEGIGRGQAKEKENSPDLS